jgi:predicted CXXCH cytochrome family protein
VRKTTAIGLGLGLILAGAPTHAKVVGTRHDLSARGPGLTKAFGKKASAQEDVMGQEICVFCHAPHTTTPATALWNRSASPPIYKLYSSSTLDAVPGQPSFDSKLCLSCHDGTIAVGAVLSRRAEIPTLGTLRGPSNLTTDLSDDHPISFAYDAGLAAADPELVDPSFLMGDVKPDEHGQLQCTSCHDPHGNAESDFLLMDTAFSALCVTCHRKIGWSASSHANSGAVWRGGGADLGSRTRGKTVASNGCDNCHLSHAAGLPEYLLHFPRREENCLVCHDGSTAKTNIAAELNKPYGHPVVSTASVHDPTESFMSMPRHAACEDCHNPHAAREGRGTPPSVSGPLEGAPGVNASGAEVRRVSFQYEVCFRCHADSPNAPVPTLPRQISEPNLRLRFDVSAASFHPVEAPGRNPRVPSLIPPLDEASLLYCADCHTSDLGRAGGAAGPSGPHGSVWPFLLEQQYQTGDNTPESFEAYALCYKCHDRNSILRDESFREHSKHIEEELTPCSACHDPHGISSAQGSAANHSHLINFDTSIVFPDPDTGLLRFEDLGDVRGRCYLDCHGVKHSPESY